jgi:hypothetical protein
MDRGEQSTITPLQAGHADVSDLLGERRKSLRIERMGQTWLPMGRPSGLAANFSAVPTRNPAAPEPIATVVSNWRLDISIISTSV